jgi:hypothetical protein
MGIIEDTLASQGQKLADVSPVQLPPTAWPQKH